MVPGACLTIPLLLPRLGGFAPRLVCRPLPPKPPPPPPTACLRPVLWWVDPNEIGSLPESSPFMLVCVFFLCSSAASWLRADFLRPRCRTTLNPPWDWGSVVFATPWASAGYSGSPGTPRCAGAAKRPRFGC
uniref:Uncharacterized protein n=1 Tax=Anopheles darlingi TaxID=43151 RepID=A0A2M4DNT8_ANODA